jgi:hypothetical protein
MAEGEKVENENFHTAKVIKWFVAYADELEKGGWTKDAALFRAQAERLEPKCKCPGPCQLHFADASWMFSNG